MKQCEWNAATLAQYLDGELPPDQASRMQQHISGCPQCAAEVSVQVSMKRSLRAADRHSRELAEPVYLVEYVKAYNDERRRLARDAGNERGKLEKRKGEIDRELIRASDAIIKHGVDPSTLSAEVITGNQILGPGSVTQYMPTTGGRPDIGPMPTWDAIWLMTQNQQAAQYALGIDYNSDGRGIGFNVPSLLGLYAVPPFMHNGAAESLAAVVSDVKHRTDNGRRADGLSNPTD